MLLNPFTGQLTNLKRSAISSEILLKKKNNRPVHKYIYINLVHNQPVKIRELVMFYVVNEIVWHNLRRAVLLLFY